MAREDILARIEAAKLAKVDAEREQANAAAAAILKQKHMASLHDRVRKALIISDENLKIISAKALSRRDELLISQQEQLNAQAGDDESLFKEAVDAGVDMSNEEKHEVVQEGRREIKGNTKEEIKNAHAEWKGASRDAKLVSEVSQAFDSMSDEEKTALDTAMESGDLDAVIKVADAYKTRNRESLISNIDSEISAKNTENKVKTVMVEELTPEEASMSTRERLKAEGVRLNIELQAQLADPEDGAKTERSIEETSEKMKDLNIKIVALQESGAMLTPEMLEALTSELAQLKNDQKLNYAKQKSRSIKEPIEWTTSPLTGNYLTYKSKDKSYPLFDGSRGTEADKKLSELTEFFGEVYNQVRKINTNQIQLPDSEHKALFSQSFDLNGLQQGLNNLNTKGQNYIKARKEMGASHEELKNDPEVIKLRKQIGVLKELVATKAESYKQEHARLEENAPKNEGEFLSRVKSVEDGFSELNNSYRGDLREIRSNYQTYLKDLKKQHPEFDVRNNPEYAALYQSSSGRSELKLEAISHKTNDDFAEFALAEIQKDPKMVAFMKDAAKKINQYGVASMELNQQKLDLRALFLPRKDWMKDTETAENMWKQLYRSNASDTLDTSFLDTNIARKFGLADLQGFEPVRVSSLPEVIDKKSS